MKRNARTLYNKLKKMGVPVYETEDQYGAFFGISAESPGSYKWADYYGEFRGGYPWINEKLEETVREHNMMLEWLNPGALGVYDS